MAYWHEVITTDCVYIDSKGTFYSESAGKKWFRHIKVPKIVPGLLFPVSDMNFSTKVLILTFFCVNKINQYKARTNMY